MVSGVSVKLFVIGALCWLGCTGAEGGAATIQSQRTSARTNGKGLPIRLHIGTIAPGFLCDKDTVRRALKRAIDLWESEASVPLFAFSDSGFAVDLKFDYRQARLNLARLDRLKLTRDRKQLDDLDSDLSLKKTSYEREASRYQRRLSDYNDELDSYNRRVRMWNLQGGAPEGEFEDLQRKKRQLAWDQSSLDDDQRRLESSRMSLNLYVTNYNKRLSSYNLSVDSYKLMYGGGLRLKVGECVTLSGRPVGITVFAFEDETDLAAVLAHELGHALGIKHVADPGSVMSAVDSSSHTDRVLRLSYADTKAFSEAMRQLGRIR
jgi:hypothetical protein